MSVAHALQDGKAWFGARRRTSRSSRALARRRWLYTYLRGFYRDPKTTDRLEQHRVPQRRDAARALERCRARRPRLEATSPHRRRRRPRGEPSTTWSSASSPGDARAPVEYDAMRRATSSTTSIYMASPRRARRSRSASSCCSFLGVLFVLRLLAEAANTGRTFTDRPDHGANSRARQPRPA